MRQTIKNLKKQLQRLRDIVQAREDKIDDMSGRWQESEACEEWQDKTQEIEAQADELDTIIDELKNLA